jgi:hypothetical protein
MEHSIGIGLKWRYGVSIRLLVFDKSPAAYSKPNYKKVYRKTYPKWMGAPG